ncbi:hypothetical protein CJG84_23175 [Salmonella enterica]|nr:hypothetical protein [Salmonella enterica]
MRDGFSLIEFVLIMGILVAAVLGTFVRISPNNPENIKLMESYNRKLNALLGDGARYYVRCGESDNNVVFDDYVKDIKIKGENTVSIQNFEFIDNGKVSVKTMEDKIIYYFNVCGVYPLSHESVDLVYKVEDAKMNKRLLCNISDFVSVMYSQECKRVENE